MNRAFTLIEVLVSVMILAVIGTGLLQISTNSKQNFIYLKNKRNFSRLASIAFIHNNIQLHNKDLTLYDFLEDDYKDLDDELRKYLKSFKVTYTHEEVDTTSPFEDSNESSTNDQTLDQMNFSIVYEKIEIKDKNNSAFAYKIYIPISGGI